MDASLDFPQRYEPVEQLGAGGGGEVWAVTDRHTGVRYALKVLAEGATEHELDALVREAVALSGLEGLGVPRVLRFGRLARSGRPFMIRELVEGQSLEQLINESAPTKRILLALALAADQLTQVHRAGFFHGDVKPANIIASENGATLVDLGLAARWRDSGAEAPGLTPKYAAPELLAGGTLTVRAEVYALGVALKDVLDHSEESLTLTLRRDLDELSERATATEPGRRHPSADEFALSLRQAANLEAPRDQFEVAGNWPVLGIEATANKLLLAVIHQPAGSLVALYGAEGSGRSALLRRLAWSLGVEGRPLVWVDEFLASNEEAILAELSAHAEMPGLVVLIDDVLTMEAGALRALVAARERGASLVAVAERNFGPGLLGVDPEPFYVPKLGDGPAIELLKRAIPSLTEQTSRKLILASNGLPGELRRIVGLLARKAVVSEDDIDEIVLGVAGPAESIRSGTPLERALAYLMRGRYTEAKEALSAVTEGDPLVIAVARARLGIGLGEGRAALDMLLEVQSEAQSRRGTPEQKAWTVWLARAHVAVAQHQTALDLLGEVHDEPGSLGAEALAFEGLALSYLSEQDTACAVLERAVEAARDADDPRVQGLALTCLGLVRQRADAIDEAEEIYQQALHCAQLAGDAGTLGTVQLNLAVLLRVRGDFARAIEHFEAAIDMGRRSGRRSTVRIALLGLANADLYLGRLARARASIEALSSQRASLPALSLAQLTGAQADLALKNGDGAQAVAAFKQCADQYAELEAGVNAAEARLEGVLAGARLENPDLQELSEQVARAQAELGEAGAHRPLVLLASARLALVAEDTDAARSLLNQALASAKEGGQLDWVWRVLETRAELEDAAGQKVTARRDRVEAVTVLEEMGARLSRDLREVFWNDPRRRKLRSLVEVALTSAPTQMAYAQSNSSSISSSISAFTRTPLEQRLARLLEINQELLGELELEPLTAKVIEYAVDLVQAERGFVILRGKDGALTVYSSSTRSGDDEHEEFSRSIAEEVIESREAVVSTHAQDDARMRSYSSVHQLLLQSVACVPIVARLRAPIGALYVETRRRPGKVFERELPTLRAFADQVALAIETQRLIAENRQRAEALTQANEELTQTQARLREALGQRTESLKVTRKKLKDARDTIFSHFGYQGIVGTSEPMRRCYALIDRVKNTDVPALITGESGTGKELVARALHRGSSRAKKPFMGINCGAIPEHLLESELFGHVRGAFTGADKERKGLLREAGSGTVLLDEIGEMPEKMQAALLRVLQERVVRPVGGSREEPIECRFVFATHRDLLAMVGERTFREDLYYRIVVIELKLPPLRERLDDIPLLVDHFLGIFSARYERSRKSFSKGALQRLAAYDWPGNVRQLEHLLLNAWVLSDKSEVEADDLEFPQMAGRVASKGLRTNGGPDVTRSGRAAPLKRAEGSSTAAESKPIKQTLSAHRRSEKDRIIEALEASNWNRVKAAELSGIARRTFYRRLREYGIQ